MQALEEKIAREGTVLPGGVLKVGSFLNQQIDTVFLKEMAKEAGRLFAGRPVTKVLTVEASGSRLRPPSRSSWACPWYSPRSTLPPM